MEQPFLSEQQIFDPEFATDGALALDRFYLSGRGNATFWSEVLAQMAGVLMDITSEIAPNIDAGEVSQKLQEIYRFQPLLGLSAAIERPHMVPFLEKSVVINRTECIGVSQLVQHFDEILLQENLLQPVPYTRIHGNLVLENMAFDIDAKKLKIIGRRRSRPFGDLREDLARLYFSFEGGMEKLKLKTSGVEGLKLEYASGYPFDEIQGMFIDWLEMLNPELVRQIPLISALDCLTKLQDGDRSPFEQQALMARSLYALTPYLKKAMAPANSRVA